MNDITLKAYAKINIGLDVTGVRDDGYHLVRMIMQTVDLYDVLTIAKSEESGIVMTSNVSDLPMDGSNLCVKAAELLTEEFGISEGISIHLEKNIPVAAGMAGGSTDAAAVLLGVNQIFELGLSQQDLMDRGVRIGADVPYCIMGGTALAEGIGEELTELSPMMDIPVLIAKPDIAVSTKYVYEHLDALENPIHPDIDQMLLDMENQDLSALGSHMGNILEGVTVAKYPVIDDIKKVMIDHGAVVSMMSGSGPTVFGFFENEETMQKAKLAVEASQLAGCIHSSRIHR